MVLPITDTAGHGPETFDPGCSPSKTCADYPGQCGAALDDGCVGTIDCSNACLPPLVCVDGESCGEEPVCEPDCAGRD